MTFKSFLYVIFTGCLAASSSLKAFCDCPEKNQLFMQDPASPMMEGMIYFHNLLMFCMIFVGIFVFYMLGYVIYNFSSEKNTIPAKFSHNSPLEIVWTIIPSIILLFIAIPSFTLLYSLDELIDPQLTLKIIGQQWYWSYEISDFVYRDELRKVNFSSYIVPTDTILSGTPWVGCRLLISRPVVILPTHTHIRLLVTSGDVLHSWAVPSFGIKIDACPGRLSQGSLFINRDIPTNTQTFFFGQCSEICGVNHGFMPIAIVGVHPEKFKEIFTAKK